MYEAGKPLLIPSCSFQSHVQRQPHCSHLSPGVSAATTPPFSGTPFPSSSPILEQLHPQARELGSAREVGPGGCFMQNIPGARTHANWLLVAKSSCRYKGLSAWNALAPFHFHQGHITHPHVLLLQPRLGSLRSHKTSVPSGYLSQCIILTDHLTLVPLVCTLHKIRNHISYGLSLYPQSFVHSLAHSKHTKYFFRK